MSKKQKQHHDVDCDTIVFNWNAQQHQQQEQEEQEEQQEQQQRFIDTTTSTVTFDFVAKNIYHCLLSKYKQQQSDTSSSNITSNSSNHPNISLPVAQTNRAVQGNDSLLTDICINVTSHNTTTLDRKYISFAESFSKSTTIQSLTLWFNLSRGLLEGATIIQSLLYNISIQHLCIANNCLQNVTPTTYTTDAEDKRLIGTLLGVCTKHHPTLRRIEFTFNDSIDDTFFVPFLHQLQQGFNRNTIVQLDIDGCNLGNDGMNALAEMLIWNSTITDLMLSSTQITDDGLQRISNTLRYQPSIRKLLMNLPNVKWDGGWVHVVTALKYNETLVDVTICYYSNNRIDEINHWSTLWHPRSNLFMCNDTIEKFTTINLRHHMQGVVSSYYVLISETRHHNHYQFRNRTSTMKGSLRRDDINKWLLNNENLNNYSIQSSCS